MILMGFSCEEKAFKINTKECILLNSIYEILLDEKE